MYTRMMILSREEGIFHCADAPIAWVRLVAGGIGCGASRYWSGSDQTDQRFTWAVEPRTRKSVVKVDTWQMCINRLSLLVCSLLLGGWLKVWWHSGTSCNVLPKQNLLKECEPPCSAKCFLHAERSSTCGSRNIGCAYFLHSFARIWFCITQRSFQNVRNEQTQLLGGPCLMRGVNLRSWLMGQWYGRDTITVTANDQENCVQTPNNQARYDSRRGWRQLWHKKRENRWQNYGSPRKLFEQWISCRALPKPQRLRVQSSWNGQG